MSDKCRWNPISDFDSQENPFGMIVKNYCETSCNNKGNLMIDMNKCPFCGREIEEVEE